MNDEPTTTQGTAEADMALGSALGSAIGARVDTRVNTPPVSLIAERAASRARARTAQRTVVGIAASITLLAGGLVTYNAFNRDEAAVIVASESTDTAPPSTDPATPENVSTDQGTGPDAVEPLVFTEHEPADLFPAGLHSVTGIDTVGDGRVVARVHGESGAALIITDNGRDWTRVQLPEGVSPDIVDVSGPRWLLTTLEFDSFARIFYSDDQGADWTEVLLESLPTGATPPTLIDALVSNQHLVVITKGAVDRQGQDQHIMQLISQRDIVSDDAEIAGWALSGNTLCFFLADHTEDGGLGACSDPAGGFAQTQDTGSSQYSFELDEEELASLDRYRAGRDQIQVHSSDGGPAHLTAAYESWHTTAASDSEGFYIAMTTPTDDLLITSTDGVEWSEASIGAEVDGAQMTFRLDDWSVSSYGNGLSIQALSGLTDPASSPMTLPGMANLASVDVTPSAAVAVAYPVTDDPGGSGQSAPRIGWSPNRTDWDWQSPAVALGLSDSEASISVALGDGFVFAHVTSFAPVGDTFEAQAPRWFKATIQ